MKCRRFGSESSESSINVRAVCDISSTIQPVLLCAIPSGNPPTLNATTGVPQTLHLLAELTESTEPQLASTSYHHARIRRPDLARVVNSRIDHLLAQIRGAQATPGAHPRT